MHNSGMRSLVRLVPLAMALVLSLGSATEPRHTAQPAPPMTGPNPSYPAAGGYYCFTLETPQTTTSQCGASLAACDQVRQSAVADGLTTSDCVTWAPVACFHLQGDPGADAEMCAANVDDCEIWRAADKAQNGATGDACQLKQ